MLSVEFEIASTDIRGELTLDRPNQALRYALGVTDVDPAGIIELRLHRSADGNNGPVVALLGRDLQGSVPIRNEDLDDLVSGNLYLVVYTRDAPRGAARGQIQRR